MIVVVVYGLRLRDCICFFFNNDFEGFVISYFRFRVRFMCFVF